MVIGDFNAKIGENTDQHGCEKFGLGVMNERGDRLLDWVEDNTLIAVNMSFRHRTRRKRRRHHVVDTTIRLII